MYCVYIRLADGVSYNDVDNVMRKYGYDRFSSDMWYPAYKDNQDNPVDAVMVIEKLGKKLDWFRDKVESIRLVHVDSVEDMMDCLEDL